LLLIGKKTEPFLTLSFIKNDSEVHQQNNLKNIEKHTKDIEDIKGKND
jgi:hypothetical protein